MFDPSNRIHPTAMIGPEVRMGVDNVIGPHAVLSGRIDLGSRNAIGAGVIMENHVVLGHNNRLFAYACIGAMGEMGLKGDRLPEGARVEIGSDCTIREHVVIHAPVHSGVTQLGDSVYLMNHAYVAHDCHLGDRVVMSHGAALGGRCALGADVNVGMNAVIHQRMPVGRGAMIGMGSVIARPVPPFAKVAGNPARLFGANAGRFESLGLPPDTVARLEAWFRDPDGGLVPSGDPWLEELHVFLQRHPDAILQRREG